MKIWKTYLENDTFLIFVMNQEKRIDTTFKNFTDSKSMSKEMCMYGLCKVHKQEVDDCPTPPPSPPPPIFTNFIGLAVSFI